jgi:O-antigen ligase
MGKLLFKISFTSYLILYFTKFSTGGLYSFIDPAKVVLLVTFMSGSYLLIEKSKDIVIIPLLVFFGLYSLFVFFLTIFLDTLYSYAGFPEVVYVNIVIVSLIFLTILVVNIISFTELVETLMLPITIFSIQSLYALIKQYFMGDINSYTMKYRFEGFFYDPNYLSLINLFCIAVALISYQLQEKKLINKIFLLASPLIVIVNSFALIATQSRSGYLSGVVFLMIILLNIKNNKKRKVVDILIFFILGGTIFKFKDFFFTVWNFGICRFEYLFYDASALSRIHEIKAGLNLLFSKPLHFLIGIGPGVTGVSEYWSRYTTVVGGFGRIHNTYFAILVENGFFGFFLFFALLYSSYRKLLLSPKEYRSSLFALFIASLFSSMFIWNLYFLPFWFAFLILPELAARGQISERIFKGDQ